MVPKLDHVNILTTNIEETVRFYTSLLGMRSETPPGVSSSRNAWIYDGSGRAAVHIQSVDPQNPDATFARVRDRLGELAGTLEIDALRGSASIEHVAFECSDYDAFRRKISEAGYSSRENDVSHMGLRQIFLNDPNGITIELNFREPNKISG